MWYAKTVLDPVVDIERPRDKDLREDASLLYISILGYLTIYTDDVSSSLYAPSVHRLCILRIWKLSRLSLLGNVMMIGTSSPNFS